MLDRVSRLGRRALHRLAEGAEAVLRLGNHGQLIVADGASRLYEDADAGRVFSAHTAASGVAPGTAIGTTAAFALWNPAGSGVDLVIEAASVSYVSGTLGAGFLALCANPESQTAWTGTAIVPVGKGLSRSAKGVPLTTATIPSGAVQVEALGSMGAALASSVAFNSVARIEVHGAIIVPPGSGLSIQGVAAAGTSPLVVFGCVWREVPRAN